MYVILNDNAYFRDKSYVVIMNDNAHFRDKLYVVIIHDKVHSVTTYIL